MDLNLIFGDEQTRLFQGDSVLALHDRPDLLQPPKEWTADQLFDGIITDPPYCSGGATQSAKAAPTGSKYLSGKGTRPYAELDFPGDSRNGESYRRWVAWWLTHAYHLVRPEGVIAMFTDWRQYSIVADALQMAGFTWRGVAVWDKGTSSRPQRGRYRQQAEFLLWGSKGKLPTGRPVDALPGAWTLPQRGKRHQTGKPLELMRQVVRIVPEGGVFLDPFAGSGTSLVAARQTGRRAVGIEMTSAYAAIAAQWIAEGLEDPLE